MYTPTDIANRALLAMGEDLVLGDIEDGTKAAQPMLLAYRDSLRVLLRGAPWQFARRQVPLELLGDASGQTVGVGNLVPLPWRYEYAYPQDCLHLRFIPWSPTVPAAPPGNYAISSTVPMIQALGSASPAHMRLRPTRFLVTNDPNFPADPNSQWWLVEGSSPSGRKVICSNVANAQAVYTSMVVYPNMWDAMFLDAMVARLCAETILTVKKDKKLALEIRREQIAIAKEKLLQARIADGNESWSTADHVPDWISARREGGGLGRWSGANDLFDGASCSGWSSVSFSDGSAF